MSKTPVESLKTIYGGNMGSTFEAKINGETYFTKIPTKDFLGANHEMTEKRLSEMNAQEFALLSIMNLLGLKTPTRMALAKWSDGKSVIFKRKIGEAEGKNPIRESNQNTQLDFDNLIRIEAVMFMLCCNDVTLNEEISVLNNAFLVGKGRYAIYDLMLHTISPKAGEGEQRLLEELYPLSFKNDNLEAKKTKSLSAPIEMSKEQHFFFNAFKKFHASSSAYSFSPEFQKFFQTAANSSLEGKEEKVKILQALGKVVQYYKINKDEISELAQHIGAPNSQKILTRIEKFCELVQEIAREMKVDIAYKPHAERPDSYVARSVKGKLSQADMTSVITELKERKDAVGEYLRSAEGEVEITIFATNPRAIKKGAYPLVAGRPKIPSKL